MTISGKAKLAGVIGWPVAQSLSPRLHAYWLAEHGIDGAYVPLAVAREDFARTIDGLRHAGFAGVNVTVPHKQSAFAVAEALDDAAKVAGAANLLLFKDGRIEGHNTDASGLAASLGEELGKSALAGKDAAILGAGGAARAAILALKSLGVASLRIVARDAKRASAMGVPVADWNDPAALSGAGILVNATSGGMTGKPPLSFALDALPAEAIVCDLVYNPLDTALLLAARARGHRTVDGLGMLMHQAVPAFEAFYGVTPRVTPALRATLEKALGHG